MSLTISPVPLSTVTARVTLPSPAGNATATGKMMGLSLVITPLRSGTVFVTVFGTIANQTAGGSANASLNSGTGTPPVNGAAAVGAAMGGQASCALNVATPLALSGLLTGLTVGVPQWVDIVLTSNGTGTASVASVLGVAFELP